LVLTKKLGVKVDTLSYKTKSANKASIEKEWIVIDAQGEILGRLASQVAKILRGKHKPTFTPHADCGDNVIILNADKVRLTGKKWAEKQYIRHTGYPGGQRVETAERMRTKDARRVVQYAVRGMIPKNRLGNAILKNLYVYEGAEHPHEAQQPKSLNLNEIK